MSAIVQFKINPDTLNLDVSIKKDEYTTEVENIFAKKILSMAVQLNFVDLPTSFGIDVGGQIIVNEENEMEYDYDYDEDEDDIDQDDDFDRNLNELDEDEEDENQEQIVETIKEEINEVILNSELKNTDVSIKTEDKIYLTEEETSNWVDLEDDKYISIELNLTDASRLVGGLTTPSSIATMMVYELLKRILKKVEAY